MPFSRRDFLFNSCLLFSSLALPRAFSKTLVSGNRGILITGDDTDKKHLSVDFVSLDGSTRIKVPMPYLVHSYDFHPTLPLLLCTEKNGENLSHIHLQQKRVVNSVKSPRNRRFNGHSVYSQDGKNILVTMKITNDEKKYKEGEGLIGIYASDNLKFISEFPSYGFFPHDCCLLDQGSTLFVLNTNVDFTDPKMYKKMDRSANYSFINIKDGSLRRKINSQNPFGGSAHLDFQGLDDLVMVGAEMRSTGQNSESSVMARMYKLEHATEVAQFNLPSEIQGFFLSIAINKQHKIAGATAPVDNSVIFCDYKSKKMLKKFNFKKPMGITLTPDQKMFIVTTYEGIKFISIPELAVVKTLYPKWEMEQSHPVTYLAV